MKCQRIGCAREATHAPKLFVPDEDGGEGCVSSVLTLTACAECLAGLSAFDFIGRGDPGRERLRSEVALVAYDRDVEPDFSRAWIEPVALTSPEWLEVERLRAGRAH